MLHAKLVHSLNCFRVSLEWKSNVNCCDDVPDFVEPETLRTNCSSFSFDIIKRSVSGTFICTVQWNVFHPPDSLAAVDRAR